MANSNQFPSGFSDDDIKALNLFHPHVFTPTVQRYMGRQRFAHYTSADNALRIFRSNQFWMRNARFMKDYSEVIYGISSVVASYNKHQKRFEGLIEQLFPGFKRKIEEGLNGWIPYFKSDTYIACLTEHDDIEDDTGRLSMLREYAGSNPVGVVLNSEVFLTPNDALKAYTYPVSYLSEDQIEQNFVGLLDRIESETAFIRTLGEPTTYWHIFHFIRTLGVCTKSHAYSGEREWRIVYSPKYEQSTRIIQDVESIGGTPQNVCKIPLADIPEENLIGVELPKLVNRIIVGPSAGAVAITEAFESLLLGTGVANARQKVVISSITERL